MATSDEYDHLKKELEKANSSLDKMREEKRLDDNKWRENTTRLLQKLEIDIAQVKEIQAPVGHLMKIVHGPENDPEKGLLAKHTKLEDRIKKLEDSRKWVAKVLWLLSGIGMTGLCDIAVRYFTKHP